MFVFSVRSFGFIDASGNGRVIFPLDSFMSPVHNATCVVRASSSGGHRVDHPRASFLSPSCLSRAGSNCGGRGREDMPLQYAPLCRISCPPHPFCIVCVSFSVSFVFAAVSFSLSLLSPLVLSARRWPTSLCSSSRSPVTDGRSVSLLALPFARSLPLSILCVEAVGALPRCCFVPVRCCAARDVAFASNPPPLTPLRSREPRYNRCTGSRVVFRDR